MISRCSTMFVEAAWLLRRLELVALRTSAASREPLHFSHLLRKG